MHLSCEIAEILSDVCGGGRISPDDELLDSGLLDSLAFIRLLDELEERGIEIIPTRVDKSCFSSARAIAKLIDNSSPKKDNS